MATAEECRTALETLTSRITELDAQDRARKVLDRTMSLRVRRSMRVPAQSVVRKAFAENVGLELEALENQDIWEVSGQGNLPSLGWGVQALRRGPSVYGILKPMQQPRKRLIGQPFRGNN